MGCDTGAACRNNKRAIRRPTPPQLCRAAATTAAAAATALLLLTLRQGDAHWAELTLEPERWGGARWGRRAAAVAREKRRVAERRQQPDVSWSRSACAIGARVLLEWLQPAGELGGYVQAPSW